MRASLGGGIIKLASRVCLIAALSAILLGNFALASGAGPVGHAFDAQGTPVVDAPPARSADRDVAGPSKRRDLESVLGREVRTRIEDGVGRIIDLLADR